MRAERPRLARHGRAPVIGGVDLEQCLRAPDLKSPARGRIAQAAGALQDPAPAPQHKARVIGLGDAAHAAEVKGRARHIGNCARGDFRRRQRQHVIGLDHELMAEHRATARQVPITMVCEVDDRGGRGAGLKVERQAIFKQAIDGAGRDLSRIALVAHRRSEVKTQAARHLPHLPIAVAEALRPAVQLVGRGIGQKPDLTAIKGKPRAGNAPGHAPADGTCRDVGAGKIARRAHDHVHTLHIEGHKPRPLGRKLGPERPPGQRQSSRVLHHLSQSLAPS